jgi:hypothetical protein
MKENSLIEVKEESKHSYVTSEWKKRLLNSEESRRNWNKRKKMQGDREGGRKIEKDDDKG